MKKFYGVSSLVLTAAAVGLGALAVYQDSRQWSLLYLLLTAASGIIVIAAFCAKCPAKTECAHVLPGLAARLLNRTPGPYSGTEMFLTGLALCIILLFPQLWLIRNTVLLITFWVLCIAGLLIIVKDICITCKNENCPFGKPFKKGTPKSGDKL